MATKVKRPRPADAAGPAAPPAEAAGGAVPRRISARKTADRIGLCAAECESSTARGVLHALRRAVERGAGTPRRAAALEAAVSACLDEAGWEEADRWVVAEAAAWALARLARAGRGAAGPDAGRHLERLVDAARAARAALADRDTRPARFVIVLARLFGDVEACRELEQSASAAVVEEIGRLVTDAGAVVLAGSTAVVDRVVRWAGVRAVARTVGGPAWDDDVDGRWRAGAVCALRLLGRRGRGLAATGVRPVTATAPLLDELARSGGKRARQTVRRVRHDAGWRRAGALLPTDAHDPAAAMAVIRTGWERDAVRVLLEYRDAVPRLEIACGDRILVEGPWDWAVTCDGRPLDAEGAWKAAGWESDRSACFLEIVAPLAGGLQIERQVVVLRRSRIVLLADAIVPAEAGGDGRIGHRAAVPLAAGLEAEPAAETREVLVYDGAMRLMALPLAHSEWRTGGPGGLAAGGGNLVLEQSGHRRLYAPLWLDCDPSRIGLPLTWRQLTVADTRRNLPPHQAAGFRVQSGAEQWLLYRALDAVRNRTLLGCNVSCGFLLGRVKRSGEVARTVEIE